MVFGKVIVPFPESVNRIWVWFICVWIKLICRSRRTGSDDSSNHDEDAGVVVVIIVADAGAAILDAAIMASMNRVDAAVNIVLFLLFLFLLR